MKLKNFQLSLLPVLTVFLGLFLQHHSLAYQLTDDLLKGSFWRTFPIAIKIQTPVTDPRRDVTEAALTEAIDEWQRYSEIPLWSYQDINSKVNTSNIVRWSNNFQRDTGYAAHSTMAITIRYSNPPLIQRTEIIINGEYPGLDVHDDLKKILIHELGHTLGLDHSDDYDSMMYSTLALGGNGPRVLSADDIDGLSSVMNYHAEKQSQPIQLEQERNGSSNPIDGIASCGQNNQDVSSFSAAETKNYNTLLVWLTSLGLGLLLPLILIYLVQKTRKLFA